MDDYLYIFDLQNNTFEMSQSAVKRFNIPSNILTDAANEVMKVVYEEDREMLAKHLADICERREKVHNLHYIRDMNPSYVKMDRDFTAKAMNSDRDYELYKNIILMVHSINVRICAEGTEEKEWLLKMKEMKVDYLQGYYFGRPCGKKQFLQQYASGINVK